MKAKEINKGKRMNAEYEVNGFPLDQVRNRNETRVVKAMQTVMPKVQNFCGCRLCVEDVYAASLNQLPSHYVQFGAIILKATDPSDGELEAIVSDVVGRVTQNPNHPAG